MDERYFTPSNFEKNIIAWHKKKEYIKEALCVDNFLISGAEAFIEKCIASIILNVVEGDLNKLSKLYTMFVNEKDIIRNDFMYKIRLPERDSNPIGLEDAMADASILFIVDVDFSLMGRNNILDKFIFEVVNLLKRRKRNKITIITTYDDMDTSDKDSIWYLGRRFKLLTPTNTTTQWAKND